MSSKNYTMMHQWNEKLLCLQKIVTHQTMQLKAVEIAKYLGIYHAIFKTREVWCDCFMHFEGLTQALSIYLSIASEWLPRETGWFLANIIKLKNK